MMRLLRLAKLKHMLDTLQNELLQGAAEWVPLVLSVAAMQVLFSVLMHFTGCLWHFLGSSEYQERTWIKEFEDRYFVIEGGVQERYFLSLPMFIFS